MSKLFKAIVGIGGAAAAVVLSQKENRDKLKDEYSKYKSNPESYKQNAKDIASQISSKAGETYNEVKQDPKGYASKVKQDPKGYASKVKQDPKGFINEQKDRFSNVSEQEEEHVEEARFTDEGAADPSNNLRVVTEEELKNNSNKHDGK
ncbi:YtxH domain-containing protein [Staphylococcus saprophyticus]|uniref:YtxH domain-containing protein n=1 Tax=Staphylococcus saprophyticus TaxID=29385 RepID=UPI0008528D57|nr:YtxH domain-containing protein [Staphylococcus saprophyticus]ASE59114.1 YtxH domain-containing protein [Staphylococcus saprophyticus]MCM3119043.1 YtxH domain-containing protein [Staphylococcus saprophyticus]MDW3879801.1 YtxH domain-containing protein [Staphylococcus saprophyticus]MDW3922187.1 YtxH domain-containing protein [Staphylococcus saprophyticus]MDW4019010.1 YtxH domain-containing protein [Staphylococcus saprophyticus]